MFAPDSDPLTASLRSVLFPTDLRADGLPAFSHALRLALDGAGKLTLLHVGPGRDVPWDAFPGIRTTLGRWGVLPPAATRKDLGALGVRARKVSLDGGSAVKGILQRARKSDIDMVVLTTQRRAGLRRWMRPSVAEAVVRRSRSACLVVPMGRKGFVDPATGKVTLARILIPCAPRPHPEVTLERVAQLVRTLKLDAGVVRMVGVGTSPDADLPEGWPARWVCEATRREGAVVDAIVDEAKTWGAHLVAMATLGHDSTIDQLRGSTTQRVLRRIEVPLLVVPGAR